jgi:sRNA-binding protein
VCRNLGRGGQTAGASTHWAVIIADGLAGLAFITAIPSVAYARRRSKEATKARELAEKADDRAEKAEQRIAAEEARNAVRWQLEVSHETNKLWLRNIGTQDASRVTVLDPGPPLVTMEEEVHGVVAGGAVSVQLSGWVLAGDPFG